LQRRFCEIRRVLEAIKNVKTIVEFVDNENLVKARVIEKKTCMVISVKVESTAQRVATGGRHERNGSTRQEHEAAFPFLPRHIDLPWVQLL